MSEQETATRVPLAVWQAETLRLTAFPSPSVQFHEPTWWMNIIGESPEQRTVRIKRGEQQEEGLFEDKKLVLRIQPRRVDWLFTPLEDSRLESGSFPTIGPFLESLDTFLTLMHRWFELETCPPVQRIAFGAVLLHLVESREAGYRQLSSYLPYVQLDSENSTDFLYQINRPRDSRTEIPGLTINRLSKWSVSTFRQFALSPTVLPTSETIPIQEHFACCLELDINTAQDFREELTCEQLAQVFQELVELGQEIVGEGDIP